MLTKLKLQTLKRKRFLPYCLLPLKVTIILLLAVAVILILIIFVSTIPLDFNVRAKAVAIAVSQLIISGAALGAASYLLQRISRNRYADVSILGLGTINLIVLCFLTMSTNFTSLASVDFLRKQEVVAYIITSFLLSMLFYLLGRRRETFNYRRLIIFGVILSFFLYAVAQSVKGWIHIHAVDYVNGKLIGSSQEQNVSTVIACGVLVLICLIYLIVNFYNLQVIVINQQIAKQLGIKVNLHLGITMGMIGVMVGASYALSGDFVYVGLLAGNIAMRKRNNNLGFGIVNAALFGMICTLLSYWFGVSLIGLETFEIGALVPLTIGPYFIYRVLKS